MVPDVDKTSVGMENNRVFIVGCPRSGNTLIQALLAAHPKIKSFPEINFFMWSVGQTDYRLFGEVSKGLSSKLWFYFESILLDVGVSKARLNRKVINKYLRSINREDLLCIWPRWNVLIKQNVNAFVRIFDTISREENKCVWVDKSPTNLGYIDIIEKLIPGAKFLHIVRNGKDTVASIYHVAQKYPRPHWWGRTYYNLDRCIDRWLVSMEQTARYSKGANHKVVKYEDLVSETSFTLKDICEFIDINYDEGMVYKYKRMKRQLILPEQGYLAATFDVIENKNDTKFFTLFNEQQQSYILNRTRVVSVEDFLNN